MTLPRGRARGEEGPSTAHVDGRRGKGAPTREAKAGLRPRACEGRRQVTGQNTNSAPQVTSRREESVVGIKEGDAFREEIRVKVVACFAKVCSPAVNPH